MLFCDRLFLFWGAGLIRSLVKNHVMFYCSDKRESVATCESGGWLFKNNVLPYMLILNDSNNLSLSIKMIFDLPI